MKMLTDIFILKAQRTVSQVAAFTTFQKSNGEIPISFVGHNFGTKIIHEHPTTYPPFTTAHSPDINRNNFFQCL
jgi:hypothetical protein